MPYIKVYTAVVCVVGTLSVCGMILRPVRKIRKTLSFSTQVCAHVSGIEPELILPRLGAVMGWTGCFCSI